MTADADTDSRTFATWTAIENDRDDLRGPLRFRRLRFLRFAAAVAGAEDARDSRRVDAARRCRRINSSQCLDLGAEGGKRGGSRHDTWGERLTSGVNPWLLEADDTFQTAISQKKPMLAFSGLSIVSRRPDDR